MAKNEYFKNYETYVRDNEAPHNYHVWTSISVLSALLGRKCYVPQGLFTVYPNLYVILVGSPGLKKSTAMNVGKNLLRTVEGIPTSPEATTREALINSLAKNKVTYKLGEKQMFYHQSTAFVTEMSEFLGAKHTNAPLINFLTTIWDENEFRWDTRRDGEVKIESPYFSLLGCTNPDWISTGLKSDVITGGFSRRMIFVSERAPSTKNPWPVLSEEQEEAFLKVSMAAQRISKLQGNFVLTEGAMELWVDEYNKADKALSSKDPRLQYYYSSKHNLVLKVAICLAGAFETGRTIPRALLDLTFKIFEQTERNLEEVFSGVGRNELKPILDKVHKCIVEEGSIKYRKLIGRFYNEVNKPELEEIVTTLASMGLVDVDRSASVLNYVLRATSKAKPQAQANLWKLISRAWPEVEAETAASSGAPEPPRQLDPEVKKRLARLEQRQREIQAGVLLKGKDRQARG